MGNGVAKVSHCFVTNGDVSRRHDIAVYLNDHHPVYHHEPGGHGHSFCYFRPDPPLNSEETTTFRSISGASVSANTSTPPLSAATTTDSYSSDRASTFESSDSFASIPLQPVPRAVSGQIERGFLSGPIERGFLSGPIDPTLYSGPVEAEKLKRSFSANNNNNNNNNNNENNNNINDGLENEEEKKREKGFMKRLRRAISRTISRGRKSVKKSVLESNEERFLSAQLSLSNEEESEIEFSMESQSLQWAQGKAGEDRVHIVISEEREWVFVGIYDGFNGPDAPDYLLFNLYSNVQQELKGLLWNDRFEAAVKTEETGEKTGEVMFLKEGRNLKYKSRCAAAKDLWKCECDEERLELDWKIREKVKCKRSKLCNGVNHFDVLRALSQALRRTEEDYLEIADKMAPENPELALMGSCVLVMLMKGEDVYLMNVGDSRAVLAQRRQINIGLGTVSQDLEMISEESMRDIEGFDGDEYYRLSNLNSLQLTKDHSTYVDKEVQRIKKEHPDDASAVMNDRVKGYLKVTRAFGVGFLKQPKWNDLLLEMFRIDYVGTSPYITCLPSLYHHRLSPKDRFLILSSDGLYQYFTNEEAVSEVELFISAFPEGDPAQHLIEEVLFRAAKKAGMDFHELLDIPPGDRRRYHDDVSVIIISLEGRIWRSSV